MTKPLFCILTLALWVGSTLGQTPHPQVLYPPPAVVESPQTRQPFRLVLPPSRLDLQLIGTKATPNFLPGSLVTNQYSTCNFGPVTHQQLLGPLVLTVKENSCVDPTTQARRAYQVRKFAFASYWKFGRIDFTATNKFRWEKLCDAFHGAGVVCGDARKPRIEFVFIIGISPKSR